MGAPKFSQSKLHSVSTSNSDAGLGFRARVISRGTASAQAMAHELEATLQGWIQLDIGWQDPHASKTQDGPTENRDNAEDLAQILFVDSATPELDQRLAEVDRSQGCCVFLIVRDGAEVPAALIEGRVDDVLVHPFRSLEVLSKLRQLPQMQAHRESLALNAKYAETVEMLQEDLKLTERLQKQRLPRRFPEVRGFRVTSRYVAGERSGGFYVDLADTRDGQHMAIVMTDVSSYRLSSAVLDTISRRMGNVPAEELRSCVTAARRIRDGVLVTLGERDHVSLFYGVLSRKDYRLKFVNLGSNFVFYAPPDKPFAEIKTGQGDPLVKAMSVRMENEGELALEPEGRLALLSDGFVETVGGVAEVLKILDQHRAAEAADTLNELVFRTKKKITGTDELPAQDCTAVLFDVDSRLIRLA